MKNHRALWLLFALAVVPMAGVVAHAGPLDPRAQPMPSTLGDAEKELVDLDRRLGEVDTRTKHLGGDVEIKERRTSARARAYARMARAGLLPVAGGFDALVSHAMKLEGARRAIVGDLAAMETLRADQKELSSMHNELAARRALVMAQRDGLAQAQALVSEAEDRRHAFERAFQSSSAAGDHVAIYGAGITVHEQTGGEPAVGFASLRGHMPFPVSGRAEVVAVKRQSASGPGVELKSIAGAAARAVAAGRVAFSATYGDYQRVVLVDHGDHFFSVYGSLGAVDVRVGDELSAGARIGAVGEGGVLYFELRKGSETIDPKPWLGL